MAEKKGASGEKVLYCSFCGKSQHEVKKLIAGPSVFICDECIELCNDIIRDEVPADRAAGRQVGQVRPAGAQRDQVQPRPVRDRPGRGQAHAVGGGLQPLQAPQAHGGSGKDEVELTKSNILLIGPTGSGKTCWRRPWRGCSTCPS
jgi:ATP-dependent Clp protease ATP-binding subunit ClpX